MMRISSRAYLPLLICLLLIGKPWGFQQRATSSITMLSQARVFYNRMTPRNLHKASAERAQNDLNSEEAHTFNGIVSLQELCQECIRESRKSFSEGTGYSSNPKEQMGTWMDQELLSYILQTVNDTGLVRSSDLAVFMMSSRLPITTKIFEGEGYEMNVISVPGGGQKVQMRNYDPGVVLVYKPLIGQATFNAFHNPRRVIQSEHIGFDGISALAAPSFIRLGGPKRSLETLTPEPCLLIEVAFFPKKADNAATEAPFLEPASFGATVDDGTIQITTVRPPKESVETGLFAPEGVAIRDALRKSEESLYLIKNAEKYNILDKISQRVGGLGNELGDIVRRVLSSRQLSPHVMRSLGLSHVKGVLLFGPPGTGKTLIAREMARALNSREPVLINGPEIMDKYIGEAERKIREVFQAAEEEWEVRGRDSELHVIIFDEFDAIAKSRGSLSGDGSGVRDSCVNQLLTKLDGIDEMNNVLVIALTNRKDLIDPALLRPGRLEVHLEIRAPDLYGREEILYLLFKPLVKGGFVTSSDAKTWSSTIAKRTFGWTGAELSGLMRSAASFSIERSLSNRDTTAGTGKAAVIAVLWEDIERAMKEMSSTIRVSKRAVFRNMLRTGVERLLALKPGSTSTSASAVSNSRQQQPKRMRREFEEILAAPDEVQPVVNDNSSSSSTDIVQGNAVGDESAPKFPEFTNIGGTLMF